MNRLIKIKTLLSCLFFLIILYFVFLRVTYLFRNHSTAAEHINGLKNEKDIDIVCVGGSSTFVYWEPFLAWHEYGMTSYNFATNSAGAATMRGCVKEVIDIAHPALVVIDVRCFGGGEIEKLRLTENIEPGVRNITDSMDFNLNRFITVFDVMSFFNGFNDSDVDTWSYFFDIAKYHTNIVNLVSAESYRHLFNNNYIAPFKGFEFITTDYHEYIEKPIDYKTNEIGELNPDIKICLEKVLDYLDSVKVQALFVCSPIPVTKKYQIQFNTVKKVVEERGYLFLNTNEYYDEMRLDFSMDFYNAWHVNVFGAEKYTRFVSDYIKSHCSIMDHRGEPEFNSWNDLYEKAHEQEVMLKETIRQVIKSKEINS